MVTPDFFVKKGILNLNTRAFLYAMYISELSDFGVTKFILLQTRPSTPASESGTPQNPKTLPHKLYSEQKYLLYR
jgi:hypothetical protein